MHKAVSAILGRQRKPFPLPLLITFLRRIARSAAARPLLVRYVGALLHPLSKDKSAASIRILVLNEHRFRADLEELGRHPDVYLLALPAPVQMMLNAICLSSVRTITDGDTIAFRSASIPEVIQARANLHAFLATFLKELFKLYRIDVVTTCSFYYAQDREWESACQEIGLPFVVLHKENMKDPVTHEHTVARYKKLHLRFGGHRLFLFNELEKQVLRRSGAVSPGDEERITIAGGLRMDAIYRRKKSEAVPTPRRQVTFFSSHHCVGLLNIENHKNYFSVDRTEGFVDWFDQVHAGIALLAAEHPEIEVWIKPKWMGNWAENIQDAIRRIANLDPEALPNLHISIEKPAQQLIEESAVIVGLNSTTLLEAKLYNRPVVLPLFAEAAGKYYERHIYFKKYQDEVFNVARSPEEMRRLIIDELDGKAPSRTIPDEMIRDYLGYFDGKVADRVVAQIHADIAASAHKRTWK